MSIKQKRRRLQNVKSIAVFVASLSFEARVHRGGSSAPSRSALLPGSVKGTRAFDLQGRRSPPLCSFIDNQASRLGLTTQAQAVDQLVVLFDVPAFQVVEQTPALRDHLEQA